MTDCDSRGRLVSKPCDKCGEPMYGDNYGPLGHACKAVMPPFRAWVAWHPVEGPLATTASRSKAFCEDRLLKAVFNFDSGSIFEAKAEAYYAARDIELIRAKNDGWRIVEVEVAIRLAFKIMPVNRS